MSDPKQETFQSSGGRTFGFVGIGLAIFFAGVTVVDSGIDHWPVLAGCALGAVAVWAVLVRPAAVLSGDRLLLRRAISDVSLPVALIESVLIRQFLVVRGAGKGWTTAGLARGRRELRPARPRPEGGRLRQAFAVDTPKAPDVEDIAELRMLQAGADARLLAHIDPDTEAGAAAMTALLRDVRRTWAWVTIVPIVLLSGVILAVLLN